MLFHRELNKFSVLVLTFLHALVGTLIYRAFWRGISVCKSRLNRICNMLVSSVSAAIQKKIIYLKPILI